MVASALAPLARAQPRITEFLAKNASQLADVDRHFVDWIEIHNPGTDAVRLEGWHLTDTATNLAQWTFPAIDLAPGEYRIVFASGKNRTNAAAQLHTNFRLDGNGEFLALVAPDGRTVVSSFGAAYPPQETDVSYGLELAAPGADAVPRYFTPPTPGSANGPGYDGIAPAPVLTPPGSVFRGSIAVSMSVAPADAEIRYTLDGSLPDATSPLYTAPVTLPGTRLLRCRAFVPRFAPSPVAGAAFTRLGNDATNFVSDLPLVVVNTFARTITDGVRVPAYFDVLAPRANDGRRTLEAMPALARRVAIEIRGSSSTGFEKKSYGLEFQTEAGLDAPAAVLDLPEDSDWVLYAPYTDKTLIRDVLAYELSRRIGRYAPRTRFVELFVNRGNTDLQAADYAGIYVVVEKLKIAPDRVDVAAMEPADLAEPAISGGYLLKRDRFDANDQVFTTGRGVELGIEDPKRSQIGTTQRTWIRTWLNRMESALYGSQWRDPVAGYRAYLDGDSFIDHHWLVEAARNIDGYRLSTFWHKDRAGRLRMGPIWDYNLSFGNADYLDGWQTSGWYYMAVGDPGHTWLSRLLGDPDYQQRRIDRWFLHRAGPFATTNLVALVDALAGQLRDAQARNFTRWKILGQYVWPNWYVGQTWQQEIDWMKRWTTNRFAWIDRQFIAPPTASHPGGPLARAIDLTLRPASGTLYYTTDGTDPRLAGGTLSTRARAYGGPIPIATNQILHARSRSGTLWSAPFRAAFVLHPSTLAVTEVMYHPPDAPGNPPPFDAEQFEFVEIANVGPDPVSLAGTRFGGDVRFVASADSETLLPGEHGVVVRNPSAFTARYGAGTRVLGTFEGELPNGRGRITLEGPFEEPLASLDYDDAWYPSTDGRGNSLTAVAPPGEGIAWNQPANWRPSLVAGGTPGRANVLDRGAPLLVAADRVGSTVRLRFRANPGAGIRLERRVHATLGPWETVGWAVAPASGSGSGEILDSSPPFGSTAFYRLVTPRR